MYFAPSDIVTIGAYTTSKSTLFQISSVIISLLFFHLNYYKSSQNKNNHITLFILVLSVFIAYLGTVQVTQYLAPLVLSKNSLNPKSFHIGFSLAILFLIFLLPILQKKKYLNYKDSSKFFYTWVVSSILFFGIYKFSCFLQGCCFGDILLKPWAVIYKSSPNVNRLFVPLHPVQLYEAFSALLVLFVIFWIWNIAKKKKINTADIDRYSANILLLLFFSMRFFLSYTYGNRLPLIFNFTFDQVVSLAWMLFIPINFYQKIYPWLRNYILLIPVKKIASLFIFLGILLSNLACDNLSRDYFPNQPPRNFEIIDTELSIQVAMNRSPPAIQRNLIYVFADDAIAPSVVDPILKRLYPEEKNLTSEILLWNYHLTYFKDIYSEIIRIPASQLRLRTFFTVVKKMEEKNIPFDIILLTHGLSNHLMSSVANNQAFIAVRNSSDSKILHNSFHVGLGKDSAGQVLSLKNLGFVFMQACQSASLLSHWIEAGAKTAIGYSGITQNYFWFDTFIRFLRVYKGDYARAHRKTSGSYRWYAMNDIIQRRLLDILYSQIANSEGSLLYFLYGKNQKPQNEIDYVNDLSAPILQNQSKTIVPNEIPYVGSSQTHP